MNVEQVQSKLAVLRDNLDKLAKLPQDSFQTFSADFRTLDSALHRLQTSIQTLIDLASIATAEHALGPPKTSFDALEKLEAAGHLPPGSTQRFAPIFGFRNRIVHLYDRVDPEIVYRVLREQRGDLDELARLLVAALGLG